MNMNIKQFNCPILGFFLFLFLFLNATCLALTPPIHINNNINNNINNKDPIIIEANTLELDTQQGVATYLGHVILKQNGKTLHSDKMIIYRNAKGKLDKIFAFGKPAYYSGAVKNEMLLGEANKITLLYDKQEMILEGQAKLTQKQDSFTAPLMTYHFQTKMVRSQSHEGVRPTLIFHPS